MKPVYDVDGITLYHGDCREILPGLPVPDVVIADPPYGVTSLVWDRRVKGWLEVVPGSNLWCFGSLRFFMHSSSDFEGWTYAQEIIWEKHNGSGFAADRFKRVHELAVQFYRGPWRGIYRKPVTTADATKRTIRRKTRPTHAGHIEQGAYQSVDGGPRLQRSVIKVRSEHGRAVHPTQKPVGIILPLIEYSCPPGGLVIDPMAGSGTTLIAAKALRRRAIGVEINETFIAATIERLRQGVLI